MTVRDRDSLAQERLPLAGRARVARRGARARHGAPQGRMTRAAWRGRRSRCSPLGCGGSTTVTQTVTVTIAPHTMTTTAGGTGATTAASAPRVLGRRPLRTLRGRRGQRRRGPDQLRAHADERVAGRVLRHRACPDVQLARRVRKRRCRRTWRPRSPGHGARGEGRARAGRLRVCAGALLPRRPGRRASSTPAPCEPKAARLRVSPSGGRLASRSRSAADARLQPGLRFELSSCSSAPRIQSLAGRAARSISAVARRRSRACGRARACPACAAPSGDPANGPALDDLAHELERRGPRPRCPVEHVDVGEVRRRPRAVAVDGAPEADLAAAAVEADDVGRSRRSARPGARASVPSPSTTRRRR